MGIVQNLITYLAPRSLSIGATATLASKRPFKKGGGGTEISLQKQRLIFNNIICITHFSLHKPCVV